MSSTRHHHHFSKTMTRTNHERWNDNQSPTASYHRSPVKQFPILRLPINPIQRHVDEKRKQKRRPFGCSRLFGIFCCCFLFLIGLVALIIALLSKSKATTTTTITTTTSTRFALYNVNMLINGDAETGACEMGAGVTSPIGWNYNGTITQTSYNNTVYAFQRYTTPGPSDRGNCYFSGQLSRGTTMWQTIDLNNYIDSYFIDNQTVKYNLSAWLGGFQTQDDSAKVTLLFYDQFNQTIGNGTQIGPVLAIDRGNKTSLVFRQTTGLVPIGAYSLSVWVKIVWTSGSYNNGDVDNISIFLYS